MDDFQTSQNPYAPSAPPTLPGALPQYQPATKWPTILGVIGIVFGILAALGAAWNMVSFGLVQQWVPPEMKQQIQQSRGWTMILSLLTLAPAILLLIAGIGLSGRRRWGVSLSKIWAVLKMLVVLITLIGTWPMQRAAFNSPAFGGASGPPSGLITILQGLSIVIGLAWGCALPVFMLVWLSREKIKAEVATWR